MRNHRGTRYGVHAVDQISEYFGWDRTTVYNALKLAQEYTEEEIDELTEMRLSDGRLLSYSHLMMVLSIPREQRDPLVKRVVNELWTHGELARYVVKGREPARLSTDDKRGRPIGKPRTFDSEVVQMETFASDFINRTEQVWDSHEHSLDAKLADFSCNDYTEERANRVQDLARLMAKLSTFARKLEEATKRIYALFLKKLNVQKSQQKMIEEQDAMDLSAVDAEVEDTATETAHQEGEPLDVDATEKVTPAEEETPLVDEMANIPEEDADVPATSLDDAASVHDEPKGLKKKVAKPSRRSAAKGCKK